MLRSLKQFPLNNRNCCIYIQFPRLSREAEIWPLNKAQYDHCNDDDNSIIIHIDSPNKSHRFRMSVNRIMDGRFN